MIIIDLCILETSNIESLNVKYNLNNNIPKIHINVIIYETPTKTTAICSTFQHKMDAITLMIIDIMLPKQAMKYTILMDMCNLLDIRFLIDIINIIIRISKHIHDGMSKIRKVIF